MSKAPNDRKNIERQAKLRYAIQSGQSSIHGDTNYEIQTQESQTFGFYASTGQGASEGGGLAQVNMFYIRQVLQQRFLVGV